jgi:hypothetical protein
MTSSDTAPHTPDLEQGASYRPMSGWALAALALGLASPLALAGPLLWLVPAAGVVCGLIAVRQIRAAAGDLAGFGLAWAGLWLALVFLIAGPVHTVSRNLWLGSRAATFADGWFELLRHNQTHEAHQMSLRPFMRLPLGQRIAESYARDPEMEAAYERFLQNPVVEFALAAGGHLQARRRAIERLGEDPTSTHFAAVYELRRDDEPDRQLTAYLHLQRITERGQIAKWQVRSIKSE